MKKIYQRFSNRLKIKQLPLILESIALKLLEVKLLEKIPEEIERK
jgi:hypothetical protein